MAGLNDGLLLHVSTGEWMLGVAVVLCTFGCFHVECPVEQVLNFLSVTLQT